MKSILSSFLFLGLAALLLTGCEQDKCTRVQEYTIFEPVYKTLEEMRKPVVFESARPLKSPGKIFYYKGYLLINEINEGIHVFDNLDPEHPQNLGFLSVPGNLDMAVNNNTLYVDSYLDLVAIDLTNPQSPVESDRELDVFQKFYPLTGAGDISYLVEYKPTQIKETIDCSNPNWGIGIWFEGDVLMTADASFGGIRNLSSNASVNTSVVTGGSMARFTVVNDYLYTIDGSDVKVFDVHQVHPEWKNDVVMQWGIETLFPMAGNLFVGSNNGLLIYDISNPELPEHRSTFAHATSCDPVVVQGDVAFVTLRNGTPCNGFTNQLDVIDVSDLWNPSLIRSYPMSNPHGLSVLENTLYLCEGAFGFKTFDIANLQKINQNLLDHIQGLDAYDVIVLPPGDHVMVVGKSGLYQFDASDRSHLKEVSVIEIGE